MLILNFVDQFEWGIYWLDPMILTPIVDPVLAVWC